MDFIQIIKSEHARVNDILDKLSETSDGAMKTRERLVGHLVPLLDEHSRKEEAFLYPALLRHREAHKEASDFLDGARQEHDEVSRLAAALDGMAKDDENFLRSANELKKLVHHHMREEERILPAIRKAMSDEEIQGLDEALSASPEELPERIATEGVSAALRQGAETATEGARRLTQEVAQQAEHGSRSMLAAAEIYSETAQLTAEDLQAITTCSTIAAGGMTELRQTWMDWLGRTLRSSARASQELLRCTTIEQVAEVQRSFLKENLDHLLEGSAQMLRISGRVSEDARRPIEDRVTHHAQRGHAQRGKEHRGRGGAHRAG